MLKCLRIFGNSFFKFGQTSGNMMKNATTQRKKDKMNGGTSFATARPMTKLPPQKMAAKTSKTCGGSLFIITHLFSSIPFFFFNFFRQKSPILKECEGR